MTIGAYSFLSGIDKLTTSLEKCTDRIAKAIESKQVGNSYNVYVTTSGAETTRDVAAAVQEAIKRADRGSA